MGKTVMNEKYSAYPEYKDSEIEWVGFYPADWNLTRVKFESYVKARVGWHGLKSDDFTDEGPYLVTGSDFKGPEIDWKECYHCEIYRYDQDPYIQLVEGDLLITKDGTIGKVALVNNLDGKATLNSGVFVVRPLADNYTSRFYFWLLQSSVFTGFVDFNKTGSTIVHLYQDTFVNFRYAMPSFFEQQKIANFLDHEITKIDTLIEKQQQLIALLKEKRQAVISHAVTKGLNPNAPMKNSGVEWLGDVPEHWNVAAIRRYLVEHRQGYYTTDAYVDDGTKLLRITDLRSLGEISISDCPNVPYSDTLKNYLLEEGDVVFARTGGAGSFGVIPSLKEEVAYASYLIRFRFLPKHFNTNYLRFMLVADSFQLAVKSNIHGGVTQNIHAEDIKDTFVASPPLEEQKEISLYLDKQSDKYAELISQADLAIQLMQERRTALISAAVTGKIDVRNWQAPAQNNEGT